MCAKICSNQKNVLLYKYYIYIYAYKRGLENWIIIRCPFPGYLIAVISLFNNALLLIIPANAPENESVTLELSWWTFNVQSNIKLRKMHSKSKVFKCPTDWHVTTYNHLRTTAQNGDTAPRLLLWRKQFWNQFL